MAFDLTSILIPLGTAGLGLVTGIWAPKFKRDETKIQAELEREKNRVAAEAERSRSVQASEDKFQQQVMEKLEKSEAKIDLLNERINAQALEIAQLTGKVQILEHSEGSLKLANIKLQTDLDRLRHEREALDFENQAQAQKIAELQGRLAQLTMQIATPQATGGTP